MKECYTFSIKNNHIICNYESPNKNENYIGFKAENTFRKIDKLSFDKVIANSKIIKLTNDEVSIIIKDVNTFNDLNILDRYLKNTLPKIKKAIKKYQIEKNKNKICKNIKLNSKKVAAGALTCSILLSAFNINKLSKNDDSKNDYDDIKIENNNDSIQNNVKVNNLTNNTINENSTNIISNTICLDIECKYNSPEYNNVRNNYGEIIDKYSNKWGISPTLVTAIMSQESGGRYTNLMNIIFASWEDQIIKIYNHEDNCYTKLVLTNNSNNYNEDIICINPEELMNKNTNISYGSAILAYSLNYFNYNIPLAITAYNCGTGGVNNILKTTSYVTGIDVDTLINDPSNNEFLNYTYVIDLKYGGTGGDVDYLKHVLRYVEDKKDVLYATDTNNITHTLTVNFQKTNSKIH